MARPNQIVSQEAYAGFAATRPEAKTTPFYNPTTILIPARGTFGVAQPYPAEQEVTGLAGRILKVTVTLHRLSHDCITDVGVLLVGPGGQSVVLMNFAAKSVPGDRKVRDLMLTFDDAAATGLSRSLLPMSGTYEPSDNNPALAFAPPASPSPYDLTLSVFNGADPNGVYKLFVQDFGAGDTGRILEGWTLNLTTTGTEPEVVLPLVKPSGRKAFPVRQEPPKPMDSALSFLSPIPPGRENDMDRETRKQDLLRALAALEADDQTAYAPTLDRPDTPNTPETPAATAAKAMEPDGAEEIKAEDTKSTGVPVAEIPPTAETDLPEPLPPMETVSEAILREEEAAPTKATISTGVTVMAEETLPVEGNLSVEGNFSVEETFLEDAVAVEPAENHESAIEDDIPGQEPKSSPPSWWQEAVTPAPTAPERPWWDVL